MTNGNKVTAWLVHEDRKRDYSAADHYGEVKVIFSSIDRNFNPDSAIEHTRRVLGKAQAGDYLVLSGDPALCGICITVMSEYFPEVKILRWDRVQLNYAPMTLSF